MARKPAVELLQSISFVAGDGAETGKNVQFFRLVRVGIDCAGVI